jgi:hypothetical protein
MPICNHPAKHATKIRGHTDDLITRKKILLLFKSELSRGPKSQSHRNNIYTNPMAYLGFKQLLLQLVSPKKVI